MPFDPSSAQEDAPPAKGGFDPATAAPEGESGGLAKNFGAGFEEGLTNLPSTIMGGMETVFPGLKAVAAVPLVAKYAAKQALGNKEKPSQAELDMLSNPGPTITHTLNKGLGLIGLNPEDVPANTSADRIARMAGTGATAALAPEFGEADFAAGLGRAAGAVPARLANSPIMATARKALTGIASGTGAGTAGEAVPDSHPGIKQAIEILGGIAGGAAAEAPSLARAAAPVAKRLVQPFTPAGREYLAGETLRNRATDPNAVLDSLSDENQEIVPGSQPTTFQQTGDLGLGGLEREVATKTPAPFLQRRADQNAARHAALTSIQDNGDPDAIGTFLRGQFRNFDDQTQQHIDALTAHAQQQTESLGGSGVPEEHGAFLRDALQQAENTARARERSLWQSVDPDRNLVLPTQPTVQAATDIMGGLSPSAKPMAGEEAAIFDLAANYQPQMPFAELSDLRSRTSAAMREELIHNGATPAYARLSRLRGAIQNNLADAATNQASQDAVNVSRATLPPDMTIANRILDWQKDFYGNKSIQSRASGETGFGADATIGSTADAGLHGTEGQAGTGSGSPAGPARVPAQPFDQDAADRLAAATQATKERAGTFGQGPAKQVLAKAGTQDAYRLPEARVPEKYFHAGPTSFHDIQGLRQSIGDDAALPILRDYAAASLRKAAERADGTLDPRKVAAWQTKYGNAMRAFPELGDKFSTAANASDAIAESAAARDAAIKDRNASAIGKVMKAESADDVTKTIGNLFGKVNSTQAMQQLASAAARSPEAMQGLRQAVADHIASRFVSNTEAGTSGQNLFKSDAFQSFVKKNRGALSQVFNPEEMTTFDNLAADLKRANRSVTAAKLPGGSNTAQDLYGMFNNSGQATVLDKTIMEEAGAMLGAGIIHHAKGTFLGWMGAKIANAARNAAMSGVNDLVTKAMLNPDLARDLLRRAPAEADSGQSIALASRLRRIAQSVAATRLGPAQPKNGYAKGGRTHSPSDAGKTVPESMETLKAQQDQLVRGLRPAMLFPKGGHSELPLPDGMKRTTSEHGIFHFNPKKTNADAIRSHGDHLNHVLNLGPHSKTDVMARIAKGERPAVVTERTRQGTEVRAAAATHLTAPGQVAFFERTKTPGNTIQTEHPGMVMRDRMSGKYADGGHVHAAANEADPEPSAAQIESGNYKKGHLSLHGFDITIETAKGSARRGVGADGKPWENRHKTAHYGYIKRTCGADGEHVDCYIGAHPQSERIFVVDQFDPKARAFDEHKVVFGARTMKEAKAVYDGGFSDASGPRRRRHIHEVSPQTFRAWLDGSGTARPFAQAA